VRKVNTVYIEVYQALTKLDTSADMWIKPQLGRGDEPAGNWIKLGSSSSFGDFPYVVREGGGIITHRFTKNADNSTLNAGGVATPATVDTPIPEPLVQMKLCNSAGVVLAGPSSAMFDLRSSSWTEGFNGKDGREERTALVREKWSQKCPGDAEHDATEFQFGDPQKTRLLSEAAFENLWDGGEPSGDIKVLAAHGGPAFKSKWPCIGNPQLGTLATVQRKTKEFIMPAGYPDAEWQVVLSCFALGDPDNCYEYGRQAPDEANEFKLLKNGLHIVLGFETRVHSDLDKANFAPVEGGLPYQPLDIKLANFMADMKLGTKSIQEAWLDQMASGWYWRREGKMDREGEYAEAWREIPRIIACNLGSPSAMAEMLPVGNAPKEIAADIAPGQRTHVYQKNEVVGTAPTRPAAYRISPTSPWPVTP
jgi:hypothetical protein